MKRLIMTLLVASVGVFTSAQACGCDPCPNWCCGSFEVGAQAIYLRPTSCDLDFVISDPRPFVPSNGIGTAQSLPQGKHHGIDPDYEWGFRVSVGYIFDCSCYDVRVEYTYLHSHDKSCVRPEGEGGLWPTFAHPRYMVDTPIFNGILSNQIPAVAKASAKFDYDAVDLQFASRSVKNCNLDLRVYAGLHFANIDHRFAAEYRGTVEPGNTSSFLMDPVQVRWNKNTWGIGPLFGLDLRYQVACGFGIGAHVGAAILAGETDGRYFEHDLIPQLGTSTPLADEIADVCHPHRNILFPYFRTGLGINYLWCCGDCFNLLVELGYEFNSYINTIHHFRFNDTRGTGSANCYSFNLDGLYLSFRVTL